MGKNWFNRKVQQAQRTLYELAEGQRSKGNSDGATSVWLLVTSRIPQGSILESAMVNISINDLDVGV